MEENINNQEGLGSVQAMPQSMPQTQIVQQEKASAVPNSSLQMLNEKRVADNVVQEKDTEMSLSKIRNEAKNEVIMDMQKQQMLNNRFQEAKESAARGGYDAGLGDMHSFINRQNQNQIPADNAQTYQQPQEMYAENSMNSTDGLGSIG